MSDLLEIKNSITRIEGRLETLATEVKAGDRGSEASVRLLTQAQEFYAAQQMEDRRDLKGALEKFSERTEEIKLAGEQQANNVRKDLERQIGEHRNEEAPHNSTLGTRITSLESFHNKILGAMALMLALGLTNIILFFTRGAG